MAPAHDGVSDPRSPDYDPRSPFYDITADPSSKYYVGPLVTDAVSGNELRAQAAAEIDDEIARGWFGKAVDPAFRDKKVQDLYERNLEDARRGLDEGLAIRQTGGAPKTLWANATHEQMNEAIARNANSAAIGETSEEWVSVGNELATHQESLAGAITKSAGNWQGDAGDAVREHLAGVGRWLGATAQGATLTGRQQQVHSQTLNETQKAMAANPPVAFSVQEANARLQQVTDPLQYAAQASQDMAQYRAQQAAREHAAQIMTQFDETIGAAVATPRFPAPPKLPGTATQHLARQAGGGAAPGTAAQPLLARTAGAQAGTPAMPAGETSTVDGAKAAGLDAGGGPGGGVPGIPGGPGGGTLGIPDGTGGSGGGFGGSGSGISSSGFTPPPLNIPDSTSGDGLAPGKLTGAGGPGAALPHFDDSTTTSGFSPAASSPTGSMPGLNIPDLPGGGSPVRGGGPGPGFTPPPFTVPGDVPGGGPLGVPGGGPGSGSTPTIGRMGGINGDSIASRLGGGSGLGAGGLGGSGTGGTAGSRMTGGLAPGGAAGAAAEAEALAARNAAGAAGATRGAAGAPGMSGMGGMGGAKGGKGEEDKEHRLADYVENDDPDAFSPDEVVAPPVIGDWTNTDWK